MGTIFGKILVIGSPRSGTSYFCKAMDQIGVYLGNENIIKADGLVSFWAMRSLVKYKNMELSSYPVKINKSEFPYIVHQTRNPINVISSQSTLKEASFSYMGIKGFDIYQKKDMSLIRKINYDNLALGWIDWNRSCSYVSMHNYQIEKVSSDFKSYAFLMEILGLNQLSDYENFEKFKSVPTNINSRKDCVEYKTATLNMLSKNVRKQLIIEAKKYGYEL